MRTAHLELFLDHRVVVVSVDPSPMKSVASRGVHGAVGLVGGDDADSWVESQDELDALGDVVAELAATKGYWPGGHEANRRGR